VGATYSAQISGPGNVCLGAVGACVVVVAPPGPGPDMVFIPDTAVVGLFLVDTPIHWMPSPDAVTDIVMQAGKTAWVYGLSESGAYYRVMMAGKFFWVPVQTMGPNPDEVWKSRPLPTVVIPFNPSKE
jgi:hypothetical protein